MKLWRREKRRMSDRENPTSRRRTTLSARNSPKRFTPGRLYKSSCQCKPGTPSDCPQREESAGEREFRADRSLPATLCIIREMIPNLSMTVYSTCVPSATVIMYLRLQSQFMTPTVCLSKRALSSLCSVFSWWRGSAYLVTTRDRESKSLYRKLWTFCIEMGATHRIHYVYLRTERMSACARVPS